MGDLSVGHAGVPDTNTENKPPATKIHPNPHLIASDRMRMRAASTTSVSRSHYYTTTKKCKGVTKLIVPKSPN